MIMETPLKKVSIGSVISGFFFGAIWICGTCVFGFAEMFASGMAGGSPNVKQGSVMLLTLFVVLGAGLITFAGFAGGAAIAAADVSEGRAHWKTFGKMIACGLGLQGIGFLLLLFA